MKKIQLYLPILFVLLFSACKKENKQAPQFPAYTCTTCKLVPDAIEANNTISKGVYKGVVLGSSGTIQFDIANNGTAITAVMVLDGQTVNLSSSVTLVNGQPYIANFTGILNGAPVSINFSVDLNGANPAVTTSSIPGHPNATILIVKETSTALIECIEGTYSTTAPETGTFNIILSRALGRWTGIPKKTGDSTPGDEENGIMNNNDLIDPQSNNRVIGTLNIDAFNGSFVDGNGRTVTLTGKRTL